MTTLVLARSTLSYHGDKPCGETAPVPSSCMSRLSAVRITVIAASLPIAFQLGATAVEKDVGTDLKFGRNRQNCASVRRTSMKSRAMDGNDPRRRFITNSYL